jgi:hypothetical protein
MGLLALLGGVSAVLGVAGTAHAQFSTEPAMAELKGRVLSERTVQLTWFVHGWASVDRVRILRVPLGSQGEPLSAGTLVLDARSDAIPPDPEHGLMSYTDRAAQSGMTYRYVVQLDPDPAPAYQRDWAPLLDWSPRQVQVKTGGRAVGPVAPFSRLLESLAGRARGSISGGSPAEAVRALGDLYRLREGALWLEARSSWPQLGEALETALAELERAFRQRFGGAPAPVSGQLVAYAPSYRFPPGTSTPVKVGSNLSVKLSFYNKGDGPVQITRIDYPDPPFFAQTRPELLGAQVSPNATVELVVTFRPTAIGEFRDHLTIHTNGGSVTVELIGLSR